MSARFLLPGVLVALLLAQRADANQRVSLFSDLSMRGGALLSAESPSMTPNYLGAVLVADKDTTPTWRLGQWGTRHSLASATVIETEAGARTLANDAKTVTLLPGAFEGDGVLLAVSGGVEYGGRLRQYGEHWAHLLLEQYLDAPALGHMRELRFSVSFCVDSCKAVTEETPDPSLHTGHINAFFTLHNRNESSPDYNDMIWFGLPLFDVRHPIPPGHAALDTGSDDTTGKFIYTVDGARFYDKEVAIGEWHTLACDILPLAQEALAAARQRNFLEHTSVKDLTPTTFNIGWEVPGPYDCAVRLRGLRLDILPEDGSGAAPPGSSL